MHHDMDSADSPRPPVVDGDERRTGSRVAFRLPIELTWGDEVASGYTVVVNDGGGLVESDLRVPPGEIVGVTNLVSGESTRARVAAIHFGDRQRFRIGLAFVDGDHGELWGQQYKIAVAAILRQQYWGRWGRPLG